MQIDEDALPETPGTGLCVCGAAYYFERPQRIGGRGHFHCLRCGRRFRFPWCWTPGKNPDDDPAGR